MKKNASQETPIALLAPGVGSTASFVERCFASSLRAAGFDVVGIDLRTGRVDDLADELVRRGAACRATLLGGLSIGALAALRAAPHLPRLDGVLLAIPPALGPGAPSTLANAATASALTEHGPTAWLDRIRADPAVPSWIADELGLAWATYEPASLHDAFAAVAAEPARAAPALDLPVGVAALTDDPGHPLSAARHLVAALPHAALRTLDLASWGADIGAIGAAAYAAWQDALSGSR